MGSDYPRGTCENVVYHFHGTIQIIIPSYLRPVFSDFDMPVIDKDYKHWEDITIPIHNQEEDNIIPSHNQEEDNLIPSHNLEEDNIIPSHILEEDKKPIIQFRPGRPQILDLSHVIQFRPRPTSPPFRFPFITREQLERRKKVLMEWTLIAQVKV